MAELEQAVDAGVQSQASVAEPAQAQSNSEAPAESPQTAPAAEQKFTQSQVQAIAAKEARKAAEKAQTEARAHYESMMAQQQQSQPSSVGGVQQQSPDQIRRLIHEEAFNMSREAQAKQIEQSWNSAMDAERMADPEFADLYDALGIEQQPGLVIAMAGMENKAHVVKDLAKNPSKYANILTLANGGSPKLAQMELAKLSASIKANVEAAKQPKVDAPLSQLKPSNISGGDDGNFSVSDYRKQPWLRG